MATLNMFWYGRGLEAFKTGAVDWEGDTIKVALMTTAYTPDQGADQFWDDIDANEASGSGYTAGGETLANASLAYDAGNLRVTLDGDDVSWDPSTIDAQYVVLYRDGTTGVDDYLIGYGDAGAEQSSDGAAFSVNWHVDGILRTTATSA